MEGEEMRFTAQAALIPLSVTTTAAHLCGPSQPTKLSVYISSV